MSQKITEQNFIFNNMGPMSGADIRDFTLFVLFSEFPDYKMKWTTGGNICIRKSQTLCIDKKHKNKYVWQAKEIVLHECAHINTINDTTHGQEFYKEYIRLLKKYIT